MPTSPGADTATDTWPTSSVSEPHWQEANGGPSADVELRPSVPSTVRPVNASTSSAVNSEHGSSGTDASDELLPRSSSELDVASPRSSVPADGVVVVVASELASEAESSDDELQPVRATATPMMTSGRTIRVCRDMLKTVPTCIRETDVAATSGRCRRPGTGGGWPWRPDPARCAGW